MAMPVQGNLDFFGVIVGPVGPGVVVSGNVRGNTHGHGPGARDRREGHESRGTPKRGSNHRESMPITSKWCQPAGFPGKETASIVAAG